MVFISLPSECHDCSEMEKHRPQESLPHGTPTTVDPGMSLDAQRTFEVLAAGLDSLGVDDEWRGQGVASLREVLSDKQLSGQVVDEALRRGAWRFMSEVLHSEFTLRCSPSTLLAHDDFCSRVDALGRPLSDDEVAKIAMWRSILLASPWKEDSLNGYERQAWQTLSFKTFNALARSSVEASCWGDPGQLVHVIDVVNLASRNVGVDRQSTRITIQEAFQGLIDCLAQARAPLTFASGPLCELDLSLYKSDAGFRKSLMNGALKSESQDVAVEFLLALATAPGLASEWNFRVHIAEKLIEVSERPVELCFAILARASDPAVLSSAMRNLGHRLQFPLGRDARAEIESIGSRGGTVLGDLLSGLDSSHARSGWFDSYPLLVQRFVQACAVARVPHGMSSDRLESLSQSRGGPLSAEQLWVALSALDSFSIEGVGTKLRALIRR